jgi:hypothetical protein
VLNDWRPRAVTLNLRALTHAELLTLRARIDLRLAVSDGEDPTPGSIRQAYLRAGVMPHPRGRTLAELRRSAAIIDAEIGDLIGTI